MKSSPTMIKNTCTIFRKKEKITIKKVTGQFRLQFRGYPTNLFVRTKLKEAINLDAEIWRHWEPRDGIIERERIVRWSSRRRPIRRTGNDRFFPRRNLDSAL